MNRKKENMPKRQMNFMIDEGDKEAFIELCAAQNLNVASVMRMIVGACVESGRLPLEFIFESKKAGSE